MLANLATLLPYLALAGLAFEAAPVSAHSVARHPRSNSHHKHLARNAVGAQAKRQYTVLTRRDGSKCRVRPNDTQGFANAAPAAEASPSASAVAADNQGLAAEPAADAPAAQPTGDSPDTPDTPDTPDSPDTPDNGDGNTTEIPETPETPEIPESETSSPAPAPTTPGGGQGSVNGGSVNVGSKFGLAWPNGDWTTQGQPGWIGDFIGSRASWYYTWSAMSCAQNDQLGLEFVPMLWGNNKISEWHASRSSWPASTKNALFFNEPNQHDQSAATIYEAFGTWRDNFLPETRDKGLRVGGAAPTSAPDGKVWVTEFEKYCMEQMGNDASKCRPDFAPVHYYDIDVETFKAYLQDFHSAVGIPLWVTEYACQNFNGGAQCSKDQTWQFHQSMANWMDGQDWIERYAPFGAMRDMVNVNEDNRLMKAGGQVADLGYWYIGN